MITDMGPLVADGTVIQIDESIVHEAGLCEVFGRHAPVYVSSAVHDEFIAWSKADNRRTGAKAVEVPEHRAADVVDAVVTLLNWRLARKGDMAGVFPVFNTKRSTGRCDWPSHLKVTVTTIGYKPSVAITLFDEALPGQ